MIQREIYNNNPIHIIDHNPSRPWIITHIILWYVHRPPLGSTYPLTDLTAQNRDGMKTDVTWCEINDIHWHPFQNSTKTRKKVKKTGGGTAFQPVKRLDIRLFGSEAAEDNVLRRHAMPRRPWPPCPRGVGLDAFVGGSGRSGKMCPFEGQPSDRTGSDQTANRPTGPSDFEMIEMVEGKERWIWKQRLAKNKDVMLGSEPVTSRTCNNSKDVPVFVREFPSWPTWSRSMAGMEAKARSRPNCTSTDLLRSTWDHLWDHLNEMIYEIISWFSTDILLISALISEISPLAVWSNPADIPLISSQKFIALSFCVLFSVLDTGVGLFHEAWVTVVWQVYVLIAFKWH